MDLNLLVRRYYDADPELHDLCAARIPRYSLEERILRCLYACMEEGIPIEDTVCDFDDKSIYSPEEAEWLFMSLKEKLEDY